MGDKVTLILFSRLAILAVIAMYCMLSFYDLVRGSRSNTVISLYQLVFGTSALASEALPLTAESSVYPFIPMMRSPKGRFALYMLIALPIWWESPTLVTRLSAYCLIIAALVTAARYKLESQHEHSMKNIESSLEERVYQGL